MKRLFRGCLFKDQLFQSVGFESFVSDRFFGSFVLDRLFWDHLIRIVFLDKLFSIICFGSFDSDRLL